MSEQEIYKRLFAIANRSDDTKGVVTSCLVRGTEILVDAVSTNDSVHAEYALLRNIEQKNITIQPEDIVYTTVEPCGKRSPGGRGEKMGDCTSNLINAGVKHVVYAAVDPDASQETRHKFVAADVEFRQIRDNEVINKAVELFNSTCENPEYWLPLP